MNSKIWPWISLTLVVLVSGITILITKLCFYVVFFSVLLYQIIMNCYWCITIVMLNWCISTPLLKLLEYLFCHKKVFTRLQIFTIPIVPEMNFNRIFFLLNFIWQMVVFSFLWIDFKFYFFIFTFFFKYPLIRLTTEIFKIWAFFCV